MASRKQNQKKQAARKRHNAAVRSNGPAKAAQTSETKPTAARPAAKPTSTRPSAKQAKRPARTATAAPQTHSASDRDRKLGGVALASFGVSFVGVVLQEASFAAATALMALGAAGVMGAAWLSTKDPEASREH